MATTVKVTLEPTNQAACVGSNATFTVVASGANLTYQWQVSTGGGPFTNIAGATSATLTLTAVIVSQSGNQYRCVVSGSLNSNAATLTVNPLPIVALSLSFDTLYLNSPTQILSGGTPSGGVFSGTGIGGGSFLPGAFALGNYTVTYRYTDANGCAASATDVFPIIVNTDNVSVFPNPVQNGEVTIIVSPAFAGSTAAVYNSAGQKVSEWRVAGIQTSYRFKWAAGHYTIVFRKGTAEVSKQLIILR